MDPTPAITTVGSVLSDAGTVATSAFGWVAKVGETIADKPLLLLFLLIPLVGLGVGLFKRLLNIG